MPHFSINSCTFHRQPLGHGQVLNDPTSPFYGPPYLFCPGDVAAPHSIKFFATPHRSWIGLFLIPFLLRQTLSFLLSLATSDTVSRPLPEHSTTQTSHHNPHICRPHRNGTPSLLSERHNAARNTRTCGIMTRHAPPCDDAKIGTHTQPRMIKVAMQHFGRRSATPTRTKCIIHISH